ncbi:MAG: hypothetical protein ACI81V_001246 [Lentimonas sp.]|jgi:hypothetical protein
MLHPLQSCGAFAVEWLRGVNYAEGLEEERN